MQKKLTESMIKHLDWIKGCYRHQPKVPCIYENGIKNTYQTTLLEKENQQTFVITGDIPAMWLRDSAAQVRPLLLFVHEDEKIRNLVKGVINRQIDQVLIDPYANAFNDGATGAGHQEDKTQMGPDIWERKYEIDSLCYPLQLIYLYWKNTQDTSWLDERFKRMCRQILQTWKREQHHETDSPYLFQREEDEEDRVIYETLPRQGKGREVAYTGMTWCGFRPSDDACQCGYLVPANMFAVVALGYMQELASEILFDENLAQEAGKLAQEIEKGIQEFGIIEHEVYGKVYAYEVDGKGDYLLMDDANVPSLLSIPYIGYRNIDDPIYQNTRRMLLSKTNPYYYQGKTLKGIGSPHTPYNYVWPIALSVQGLTTKDEREKEAILNMLLESDGGTSLMHEGVDVDDASNYTRPWFSWSNAMFSEYVLSLQGRWIKYSPLEKSQS